MQQSSIIKLPIKVSANDIYAGQHWAKRAKIKDMFLWALLGLKSQLKPVSACKLVFNFKFKTHPLDSSNCSYMAKMIEDCLVHYKILKNDNFKVVRGVELTSDTGDEDVVELIIKEV